MAATEWTTHFSKLYRDYLSAAPPESGIPDLTALPKRTRDDTAKVKLPRIVVSCDKRESSHPKIYKATVEVMHCIAISRDGNEPSVAAEVNAAIVALLNNSEAWRAFIQAKPIPERTGWMITRATVGHWESDDDEEKKTREYTLSVELTAVVDPTV